MPAGRPTHVVRFKDFELNLRAGELCRSGVKVKLQEQSFQVLAMLLEHPGELVTREEIQKRLWPNDTVVEFENSINAVIMRLRRAVGDDADKPSYIETLARRGYRLLVPVEWIGVEPAGTQSATMETEAHSPSALGDLAGKKVSHYRVLEVLGGGGMGVVYKAEDLKLGRAVALKFLPEELAGDRAALQRFEREARAASALNHPNICTIHEFGEHAGQPFMAMELLEGQTLKQAIAEKRFTTGELLDVGIQIAKGLEAAHGEGVIHRDIKPANIFITRRRQTKILDFGLAKLVSARSEVDDCGGEDAPRAPRQDTPTATALDPNLSRTGVAMGTASYMSPEQAEGKKLDARTDLFSLGAVLYEIATGKQAFSGDTTAIVRDAILNRTPVSPARLNPDLPSELERIITKSLEKDRDVRYQVASEVRGDLEGLKRDAESDRAARVLSPLRLAAVALGSAAVLVAILAFRVLREVPPPMVARPVQLTNDGRAKSAPLVTDGTRLYFEEYTNKGDALVEVSTAGGETMPLSMLFQHAHIGDISPGGTELLVGGPVGVEAPELPIWVQPLPGGVLRRVGDVRAHDVSWSPSGREIAYANGQDLYLAHSDGSSSRKLVSLQGAPGWLRFSPDGTSLRFSMWVSIWEISADGTNLHRVLPEWGYPHCCGNWTADGKYFLFQTFRDGAHNIWALREPPGLLERVSRKLGKARREPKQLTTGPMNSQSAAPSRDGRRLYVLGTQVRGELTRYDSTSREFVPLLKGISAWGITFSRDGQWVAYISYPEGTLCRMRADGSDRLQLTSPPMGVVHPHWSPDGKQIAFVAYAPGRPFKIHLISAEGGSPQQLIPGERDEIDPGWSPDGNSLIFGRAQWKEPPSPGAVNIQRLDLRTHQLSTFPGSDGLWSPRWSPDAKYVVAMSRNPNNKLLLFDSKTQKWTDLAQDDNGYLAWPIWSSDGKFVYYEDIKGSKGVYRVGIYDRKVELVVGLDEVRQSSSAWAESWFGLTPGDSPILLRDVGTNEVYAFDWQAP